MQGRYLLRDIVKVEKSSTPRIFRRSNSFSNSSMRRIIDEVSGQMTKNRQMIPIMTINFNSTKRT
jgi:hypothetical protein